MNDFISIAAVAIVVSTMSVASYAQSRDFDAASMEIQGGPIAAPTITQPTRAQTLVDTRRAAVRAEQARAWADGELDFAELEAYAVPLKRGSVEPGSMRVAGRKTP